MNRSKRSIALFIALLITVFGVIAASFNTVHDANATGGSFPLTKHGGGTTDGVAPYDFGNGPGVDRAVNPDYSIYYNSQNPEAGKYKPGECTHCHEPHASFGGSEALPNMGVDAGPDPYLAFKEYGTTNNYASLCWYCHENFISINGSGSPPGMGRWRFYQGMTTYMASSHYSPPAGSFYWPGDGSASPIWPRKNRSGLPNGNMGSCLNCHTPHGIKSADAASAYDTTSPDGTGGVPASMQTVASGNLSVNADYLIPRQLIAWEETLCERCHDASGPAGSNIQGEINKRVLAGGSGHPVDDTTIAGRHVASEALPITTKHVECYDCHNPHAIKSTNRVEGMKYVDVNGTVQDPATVARQPYIYEVCFKCHGQSYNQVFAADTPFPDVATNRDETTFPKHFSNKRKEFDPNSHQYANYPAGDMGYNTSFHPVVAPGRNGTLNLCMQLQNAFGLDCSSAAAATASLSSLTIQCTDCHNNDMTSTMQGPATYSNLRSTDKAPSTVSGNNNFGTAPIGPHGSAVKKLLRGNYLTTNSFSGRFGTLGNKYYWNNRLDTNGRPKFELCFICHEERRLLGTGQEDPLNPGSSYDVTTYTNFGGNNYWLRPILSEGVNWAGNLHIYHLNVGAVCHDCHHNVHSNVEAQNTIYGDGLGGELPPDNQDTITDGRIDTHLLNFGPQASGYTSIKPRWYYGAGAGYYRCNLICHGRNMTDCGYKYGLGANFMGGGGICGG